MLSRTILVALVGAACFATVNAQTCSASNKKCCKQIQDSENLDANALNLLKILNVDVDALTGSIGLTCTNVIGNACNAQAACCTGNNYRDDINMRPTSPQTQSVQNELRYGQTGERRHYLIGFTEMEAS
ncbi:hypothetical protein CNMCM6106_005776 [Aspergillus hiratsukae]|uniref:Hydrophobin n=1 Tax=Aspergillus hiratsukae TaxID=1194566 RepID=A0A8H6QFK8_9EURO|nr:hypothetical protein CNMCM6106_005776 [Aspergillus hiratsukae]